MSENRLKKGEQYIRAVSSRFNLDEDRILELVDVADRRKPGNHWIISPAGVEKVKDFNVPAPSPVPGSGPDHTVLTGQTVVQPSMINPHLILVQPDDSEAESIFVWVRDRKKFMPGMSVTYFWNGERWQLHGREPRFRGRY